MPSIEELLNEAESHMAAQPVNDVLEIDPETREISIPDSEIILGVETDQKAERKFFHCPKVVGNNIDLSSLELYVVFQNASNMEEGKDRYHVTDVKTTSDGYITFSWELSAKVTAYKGDVQFVVCAIKTDSSGAKQNVWNTTIAIGKCLIGLSSDMSASEEQSASDLYTQLISELNSTASAKLAEVTTQIQTVGNNQVSNVNSAGTTQVNNVQNKGTEVLASIPDTYTELDASVKQLNEQIRGKAPVITESTTIQSGSPTTVTDSAEMPLQDMVIYGKSEQKTTTGKNLAKPKLQSGLRSGITVTKYDDGSYNFKGTCTDAIYVEVCTIDVEIGKTYYFSGGAENASSTTFQTYIISNDYSEVVGYNLVKKSFKANKESYYLNCAIYKGATADFTIKPMVNLGSEALPFESYTGGKPSPSPEFPQEIVSVGGSGSINVKITGKNLSSIKSCQLSTNVVASDIVPWTKKDKIYFSCDTEKVENSKVYVAIVYYDGNKKILGTNGAIIPCDGTRKETSFSGREAGTNSTNVDLTTVEHVSVKVGLSNSSVPTSFIDNIMLCDEANQTYKSYKQPQSLKIATPTGLPAIPVPSGTSGITYTDANGQAWIADEIDFSKGKYIQRVWKAEFDGSEDEKWKKGATNYIYNECLLVNMNDRKGFCNQYIVGNDIRGIKIGNGTKALIVFDDFSDENALSNFKAHLASNPLVVMTYLDTPIETDLTEAQIQAYKSLTTFKPTSVISNDANAQMEVEYACDTKTWVTNKINTLIKEATTS